VQKSKDSFLDKVHEYLFADQETCAVVFSKDQQEVIIRYRASFTKWLSEPFLRDVQMCVFLKNVFGISESQAYLDISRIKILLGNVVNAGKEFQRHRATEMILKGYDLAAEADSHMEVKQAMAMIRAGEALVRVHKLDKEDMDIIPWDDIIPLELEPTTDVSVIGRKRIENLEELKEKLRLKYGGQPVDVSFTEVTEHDKAEDLL
jgi:hypothetical protein